MPHQKECLKLREHKIYHILYKFDNTQPDDLSLKKRVMSFIQCYGLHY